MMKNSVAGEQKAYRLYRTPKDQLGHGAYPMGFSCFIKILESMIKERLEWFIEKNEILSSIQHGF